MIDKYFYNMRTGTLHIEGFCKESKIKPYHIQYFASEQEALGFDGRSVRMCKRCQKRRELDENK